jgi:hypothetical protein
MPEVIDRPVFIDREKPCADCAERRIREERDERARMKQPDEPPQSSTPGDSSVPE